MPAERHVRPEMSQPFLTAFPFRRGGSPAKFSVHLQERVRNRILLPPWSFHFAKTSSHVFSRAHKALPRWLRALPALSSESHLRALQSVHKSRRGRVLRNRQADCRRKQGEYARQRTLASPGNRARQCRECGDRKA